MDGIRYQNKIKYPDYNYYKSYAKRNALFFRTATENPKMASNTAFLNSPLKYKWYLYSYGTIINSGIFSVYFMVLYFGEMLSNPSTFKLLHMLIAIIAGIVSLIPQIIYSHILIQILDTILKRYNISIKRATLIIYNGNIYGRSDNMLILIPAICLLSGALISFSIWFIVCIGCLLTMVFFVVSSSFMSINFYRRFYDLPYRVNIIYMITTIPITILHHIGLFYLMLVLKPLIFI